MRNCYATIATCSNLFHKSPTLKQAFFLLLFSILILPASAQNTFQEFYDTGNDNNGTAIHPTSSLTYILAGNDHNGTDPSDIVLTEVDTSGGVVWSQIIKMSTGTNTEIARGVYWEQGAIGIAGEAMNGNETDGLIVQTDGTGSVQWCSMYGAASRAESFNAIASNSFAYIAAGRAGNLLTSGADDDMLIMQISKNTGSVDCGKTFGGNGDEEAFGVVKMQNGNSVAVGWTNSFGANGKAIYVVRMDSSCNKVWSVIVDGPGDDIAFDVVEDANDGVAITGQTNSFGTPAKMQPFMLRLGNSGLFFSMHIFDNPNYMEGGRSIASIPSGGFILGGRTMTNDSIAWMMRLNQNFQPDWFHHYKGISVRGVEQFADGAFFYGVGRSKQQGSPQESMYLVHANSMGATPNVCMDVPLTPNVNVPQPTTMQVPDTILTVSGMTQGSCTATPIQLTDQDLCTTVGIEDGIRRDIRLAPNPATDRVRVDLEFSALQDTRIEVLDLQGRTLTELALGAVDTYRAQLDVSGFASGLYLVKVTAGEHALVRKLVKE